MSNCKHSPGIIDPSEPCPYCGEEPVEAPAAPFWTVAIYLVDQAYGGPEEGGWWYQCGERIDHELEGVNPAFTFNSFNPANGKTAEECAREFADWLQKTLDLTINKGRREISSVLSDGQYQARVRNGHPPHHFPETRPHYE